MAEDDPEVQGADVPPAPEPGEEITMVKTTIKLKLANRPDDDEVEVPGFGLVKNGSQATAMYPENQLEALRNSYGITVK